MLGILMSRDEEDRGGCEWQEEVELGRSLRIRILKWLRRCSRRGLTEFRIQRLFLESHILTVNVRVSDGKLVRELLPNYAERKQREGWRDKSQSDRPKWGVSAHENENTQGNNETEVFLHKDDSAMDNYLSVIQSLITIGTLIPLLECTQNGDQC
jgi:hypothetical protein